MGCDFWASADLAPGRKRSLRTRGVPGEASDLAAYDCVSLSAYEEHDVCVSAKPRMAGGAWITCSYGGYAVARQATESQRAWCVYAPLGHTFGPPCWGRGHTRSRAAQSIGPLLQLWSYTRSVIDLRASPRLGAKYMESFGCMSIPFGCMSVARVGACMRLLGACLTVGSFA